MEAKILPAAERVNFGKREKTPFFPQIRRVRRFHSRIVPTSVKWTKVFVPNIGVHLY